VTPLIDSLYTTRKTVANSGEVIWLDAEIPREEGLVLHGLIADDPSIKRTLEVGCANGLSSLHICEALRGREGAHHTIIDPFQKTDWHGVGLQNLDRSGIDFYEWLEEKSEFALPELARNKAGAFDFIFIDGVHTFDHVLLDAFYSLRLLRVGGLLVLDDCNYKGIAKVASYLKNYPCLRVQATLDAPPATTLRRKIGEAILRPPFLRPILPHALKELDKRRYRMVALKKVSDDKRPWDWYAPF